MNYFLDEEKTWLQRDFNLDRRLIKALSKLGYIYPTLIQSKCIPIIVQGKDVLVRAKTGSGKTIAFSLPILQKILIQKENQSSTTTSSIKCIILAPTKELVKQIEKHITDLIYYCREIITICSLNDDNLTTQRYRLQMKPDIIISTPSKLISNLKQIQQHHSSSSSGNVNDDNNNNILDLSSVTTLILDEADLILSFGYTDDIHSILTKLSKNFQGILMSATLSAELDKFKKITLHQPVLIKLEESKDTMVNLLQFYLNCIEKDKYLILYVFMKLGLLQV
jgi:ATP-dependent RNA helicase DDX56/DBP9